MEQINETKILTFNIEKVNKTRILTIWNKNLDNMEQESCQYGTKILIIWNKNLDNMEQKS
jgi:hypothetical protein